MPLNKLLKRASSFILGTSTDNTPPRFHDGEVVFCKNNVCVHPPSVMRQDCDVLHHPGYLTVICQQLPNKNITTLRLTWIPNTTLRKNPWTIENLPRDENTNIESARKLTPDYNRQSSAESSESRCSTLLTAEETTPKLEENKVLEGDVSKFDSPKDDETDNGNIVDLNKSTHTKNVNASKVDGSVAGSEHIKVFRESRPTEAEREKYTQKETVETIDKANNSKDNLQYTRYFNVPTEEGKETERPQSLCCVVLEEAADDSGNGSLETNQSPQQSIQETERYSRSPSLTSTCSLVIPHFGRGAPGEDVPSWMSSPELLALQHNLTFPESATASPIVRRAHRCRRFSVDLSQMRSVRLFFNDAACTCGQLVVASRESQYKILHFHWGGLDHLATVLQEWNFLRPSADNSWPYRHFMVCRPEVSQEELHPEDGLVGPVDETAWELLLNETGQLEDDLALRKGIFFGGLAPSMRKIVWPFLLHCFTFQSTYDEREQILAIRRQEYEEITRRRLEMDPESHEIFWRNIQCVVEKDVVRTDRGNPYFAGEDNPNIEVMKNILLNYAVYNPGFGYTQGMSDLLAPVLAEIRNEPDAFWCFVGLMHKTLFVCTPTDGDMDRNLCFLRELIRLMVPDFHAHLARYPDAMELLFCHRWILLCFKREFPEPVALKMWEACWATYLTDYFHLFLCLAIVCVYSDDVIAQDLRPDEMLLHFSSLSMFMDGELIIRKARGLLHQFRQMPCIPCTLGSLCQLCGPGMWDSTHAPVVECTENHGPWVLCPHRGLK